MVLAFISEVAQPPRPLSTIATARSVVRMVHEMFLMPSPTDSMLSTYFVRGLLDDRVTRPIRHRPVFDFQFLVRSLLYEAKLISQCSHLIDLRDRTLLLAAMVLFARPSDLTRVLCSSVSATERGATAMLWRSKTDHDRNGTEVLLPFDENEAISAGHFALALKAALPPDAEYLFCDLRTKKPLAASTISGRITAQLRSFGIQCKAGSIRPSAVTYAAMHDADMYRMAKVGRWKQASVMMQYYDRADNAATYLVRFRSLRSLLFSLLLFLI